MKSETLAACLSASIIAGTVAAQPVQRVDAASANYAAGYPAKPIRFIVPFSLGGLDASSEQGSRLRDANVRESAAATGMIAQASMPREQYPIRPIRLIVPFPQGGLDASSEQGSRLRDANVRESATATGMIAQASMPREQYPLRPIRLIVPFPPGGGTDLVARLLSQKLTERFGQQVVVDNRGGANAIIGTDLAAKAAPDGYTLVLALPASVAVNPSLYRNLPYDPLRDLTPVIQLNSIALLLVAHPSLGANSIKELIALAKAKPGQITFGSSGTGGSSHLAMELFKLMAKVEMTHVPYKGGGPALNDLLGGQVQMYSGPVITSLPFVKAGRLKALGVTSAKRMQSLPDIPAIAETLTGYESDSWQGVLMPKGTPSAIVELLNREIAKIVRSPDVVERLASQGAEPVAGSPTEFGAYIKAETAKYAKLIKAAGIRPE